MHLSNAKELTSGLFCNGASVETRSFVFGLSLGSYCKHREARSKTTVASSVEKFPSKCESIKRRIFLPLIMSRACDHTENEVGIN